MPVMDLLHCCWFRLLKVSFVLVQSFLAHFIFFSVSRLVEPYEQ